MSKQAIVFVLVAAAAPRMDAAVSRTTWYQSLGVVVDTDKTMNIKMPDGYFVSGTLVNASGSPIKSGSVSAFSLDRRLSGFGHEGLTDASGRFMFPVQKGNFIVYAQPARSSTVDPKRFPRSVALQQENVAVNGDTAIGTLSLADGYILSGSILPPSGTLSYYLGTLMAFPSTGNGQLTPAQFGSTGMDTSKYAVALAPGSYKLVSVPTQAFGNNFQTVAAAFTTTKVTIAKDTVKNLKLARGFRISGTVRDSAGKPLTALIYVLQKGAEFVDSWVSLIFAANGSYSGYLPAGAFTLVVFPFNDPSYTGKATRTVVDVTMTASEKSLNITADNGVVLTGKLTDPRNKVLKNAGVTAIKTGAGAYASDPEAFPIAGAVNSKGIYRIVVPPDTYDIGAFPPSASTSSVLDLQMRVLGRGIEAGRVPRGSRGMTKWSARSAGSFRPGTASTR